MMTVRLRIKARTGNVSMPSGHWSFRNARSDPAEFGLGTFPAFDDKRMDPAPTFPDPDDVARGL